MKDSLENGGSRSPTRIKIPNKVTFRKVDGDDPESELFLRQWLDDVVAIEDAGEDSSVLKYPPVLRGRPDMKNQ